MDAILKKFNKINDDIFRRYGVNQSFHAEGGKWLVLVYTWRKWSIMYWWHVRDGDGIFVSDNPDCLANMDFENYPDLDARWQIIWHFTQPERVVQNLTLDDVIRLNENAPKTDSASAKFLGSHIEKFVNMMS
jgi:hypothetical protein